MTRHDENESESLGNDASGADGQEDQQSNWRLGKKAGQEADPLSVDFRVALALSKFGYGAMYTSKNLLRSRGMVQSWKNKGERHHLAHSSVNDERVEKRLLKIRRVTTFKNLDYHTAQRLFEYNLSSTYISKMLQVPVSTVINWRKGNSPSTIKEGFVDKELVESKVKAVLEKVSRELTQENLDYHLTLKIYNEARKQKSEDRMKGIGSRTICLMLSDFMHKEPIPERTISSWIKNERTPHNIDPRLIDEAFLEERFQGLVLAQTKKHINYHLAKALDEKGWNYWTTALFLGVNKERVRGWIKKDRGSPVAKTFVNKAYVTRVLNTMLMTAEGTEAAMAREEP